jgi:hypothetical protein
MAESLDAALNLDRMMLFNCRADSDYRIDTVVGCCFDTEPLLFALRRLLVDSFFPIQPFDARTVLIDLKPASYDGGCVGRLLFGSEAIANKTGSEQEFGETQ